MDDTSSIPGRVTILTSLHHSRLALGYTHPPVHLAPMSLSSRRGLVKVTSNCRLVSRLRKWGALPPLTQAYIFHSVMLRPLYLLMWLLFHLLAVLFCVICLHYLRLALDIIFHCLRFLPFVPVVLNFFDLRFLLIYISYPAFLKCLLFLRHRFLCSFVPILVVE